MLALLAVWGGCARCWECIGGEVQNVVIRLHTTPWTVHLGPTSFPPVFARKRWTCLEASEVGTSSPALYPGRVPRLAVATPLERLSSGTTKNQPSAQKLSWMDRDDRLTFSSACGRPSSRILFLRHSLECASEIVSGNFGHKAVGKGFSHAEQAADWSEC